MSLSNGWIVAIVLGSALAVVLVVGLIWFFYYRKRHYVSTMQASDEPVTTTTHDKWDSLLKSIEDEKRKEARSYGSESRSRRYLTTHGRDHKPHVEAMETVNPEYTTP